MPLDPPSWPGGGGGGIDFGPVANQGTELLIETTAGDVDLEAGSGDVVLGSDNATLTVHGASGDFTVAADDDIGLSAGGDASVSTGNGELSLTASGAGGNVNISAAQACTLNGGTLGFYGTFPGVPQQTGVPVTAAAIHAALVNLGLITA